MAKRGGLACTLTAVFLSGAVGSFASAQLLPFTDVAVARGLNYVMPPSQTQGLFGSGCGFADLDNDGDQDIIILGGYSSPNPDLGVVGIYENNGVGFFTNRSFSSGIPTIERASGFAVADYDGDGKIDLFITQMGGQNYLLRNTGNFQFQDKTVQANLLDTGPYMGVAWGDYNNDGWIDLHVCSYNGAIAGFFQNDKLYRNLGNGTFSEISMQSGLTETNGLAFQSVWFDYDRDGDLDLYVSHDRGHFLAFPGNKLFRNDGGTFVDVSAISGAGVELFSMGLACGDFDGNGWPDIYVTNLAGYSQGYNRLLLNQGNGSFVESAAAADVDHWISSWGCIIFDMDQDGHQDLYVNNQFVPDTMYKNPGSFPCFVANVNVGGASGLSYCSAVGDVDNDGDLDILVNHLGNNVQLFLNPHSSTTRRFIEYAITGIHPNLLAIGANVQTRFGTSWKYREVLAGGNGFQGQNDLRVHIGAGINLFADEVVVTWPSGGGTRTFTNVPTNQSWTMFPPGHLGDINRDGVINLSDFIMFEDFYGLSVVPGCEVIDFDGNWHIDSADFQGFLEIFTGKPEDCNNNGIIDMAEILEKPNLDSDQDGKIDYCPSVAGDIAPPGGNGVVDVDDLLEVINAWGSCPNPDNCAADIAPVGGNDVVDADDLLTVINNWS
jgi:hypothetical protein